MFDFCITAPGSPVKVPAYWFEDFDMNRFYLRTQHKCGELKKKLAEMKANAGCSKVSGKTFFVFFFFLYFRFYFDLYFFIYI